MSEPSHWAFIDKNGKVIFVQYGIYKEAKKGFMMLHNNIANDIEVILATNIIYGDYVEIVVKREYREIQKAQHS